MRCVLVVVSVLVLLPALSVAEKSFDLDSLLVANRHEIRMEEGQFAGPGIDLIVQAARNAQFVAIAEEHNVRELNLLTTGIFVSLQQHGFEYVALEQGSVVSGWWDRQPLRGDFDGIAKLIQRYPYAATFATDEELQMIATIGAHSNAPENPIWGIDQEFAALHILERLMELVTDDGTLKKLDELVAKARMHEEDRSGDTHFMSQVLVPGELTFLDAVAREDPTNERAMLASALQRSCRIYYNNSQSRRGLPTGYENAREREASMKARFMENYRLAQRAGDPLPRVLAKLGHWHVLRGIHRSNVPTFGNFLSEFAHSNDMTTFILSTYVVESPEEWRNVEAFAPLATDAPFAVIDFRPIRPLAHQGTVPELGASFKRLLFRADAALIVRGGRTGSYTIARRE